MTTEAVKQDKNKQIAETEKQPVCSGTDKTQRELTLHVLAPSLCLAGGLSPPACPAALEPSVVLQELAAATRWLACPLWERVQGDIPAPAPAPPPATLLIPSMSQTWPLQDPMQSTMQTIYFLFFFFFKGDFPTHCSELNQPTEGSEGCQGWGSSGSPWPTGEQGAETPLLWQPGWLSPSTQAVSAWQCGNQLEHREQDDLLFWNTPQRAFILQMTGNLHKSHSCGSSVGMQTACGTQAWPCTQLQVSASTGRWARVSQTSMGPADRTWDLEEQLLDPRKNTGGHLKWQYRTPVTLEMSWDWSD